MRRVFLKIPPTLQTSLALLRHEMGKRSHDSGFSAADQAVKKAKVDFESTPADHVTILNAFETFSTALSSLLSHPQQTLTSALPPEKSQFLEALRQMQSELPWLPPPPLLPSTTSPSTYPPPLPPIFSPSLRQQLFTHRSFLPGELHALPNAATQHYERLEFLGDAFLQSLSSNILHARFPSHREGALSTMRQTLVCNATLAKYAVLYNFPQHLRTGSNMLDMANAQTRTKTLGDVFEAYVGAVMVERGESEGWRVLTEWMGRLWEPEIKGLSVRREEESEIDKMAKQKLSVACGGNMAKLEYVWINGEGGNKGGYWIEVRLTGWGWEGRVLGRGWGQSKGDAQLRAAMNVLADNTFIAEMAALKAVHLSKGKPPPTEILPPSTILAPTALVPMNASTAPTRLPAKISDKDAERRQKKFEKEERERAEKKRKRREKKERAVGM
ncbi:hypothetical protein EX30DRAFT_345782 [Ascodesmis nigricans]|uniref:RNase III domain-containing protein n=1 Tax=Ascodesmis nigricans TaxID=341454 RepID=A0A4S2N7E6_9PEZI|nr:hypothetical protein EX30DRAFT_345782 [Ascodesmis nigricans]